MKKFYPYLNSPYGESIQSAREKQAFLTQIDNFVNQKQYVKITLLNWQEEPLKEIAGELTSGAITKDGSSAVRRTCTLSATVNPNEYSVDNVEMDYSINKKVFLEIGIKNYTDEYPEYPILWFPQGVFFISSFSISVNAGSTVNINLSLKDKMSRLNGDVGGTFGATVILDEMDTQSPSGEYITEKVLIYNLIKELVNHYGGEPLNNIVIEDVPLRIKRIMKWTGDNPLYLTKKEDKEGNQKFTYWDITVNKPENMAGVKEYLNGDDIGYIYDDFYYTNELTMSANETVVDALEKIKSYLGNYEYFYDEFGVFHFREIKNYLNTTQGSTVLKDIDKNEYLVEVTTGKSEFTFSDDTNLISITATPQYANIKNDYIIQGLRQATTSDISYPVRYHLAIDNKPLTGNEYRDVLLYQEESTNEKKLAFPLTITKEGDLPVPGNFNLIYRTLDTNSFYYWDDDVYKPVNVIKYYANEGEAYITKDWRTEIYLQGLLMKNYGLSADTYESTANHPSTYYQALKDSQRPVETGPNARWEDRLYQRSHFNKINIEYYFPEIEAFWPSIYDLEKREFYGEQKDVSQLHTSMTEGNFFLDIIDASSSGLGEFAVQNIGRRSDVVIDDNINCLFEPEIPDIILLNLDDEDIIEKRNECKINGQPFTQVKGDIFYGFATGGYHNAAFDQIKYELYLHTNYQKSLAVTALPAFYLEPNTRVTMNNKTTQTYGDYVIQNITIPLGAGNNMTCSMNECFERF